MRWPIVIACTLALSCTSDPPASDGGNDGDGSTAAADDSGTDTASVDDSTGETPPANYEERGPFEVGVMRMDVTGANDRELRVTVWYPTDTPSGEVALTELVAGDNATTLQALIDAAPPECTRSAITGTLDAPVAEGSFPAVVFSHCLSCLGFSSSFIAERVASHGAIVAGVTHTGDTLFRQQEGMTAPLNEMWLATRTLDVSATLDALLASEPLGTSIDETRVGVFGHSYGATTTGKVLQDDDRFSAGVAMAAPVENPILPGVSVAAIDEPMLFLVAQEDNSITEIGNNLMRENAMAMPGGSWLVEVIDAGHWSFSDLCGIIEDFAPCCGEGERQTAPGEAFTYLDADTGRSIAAAYVTAFFGLHLHDQAEGEAFLDTATPAQWVEVQRHP